MTRFGGVMRQSGHKPVHAFQGQEEPMKRYTIRQYRGVYVIFDRIRQAVVTDFSNRREAEVYARHLNARAGR